MVAEQMDQRLACSCTSARNGAFGPDARRAPGARARRGPLRLRHRRPPLHRRPLVASSAPSSATPTARSSAEVAGEQLRALAFNTNWGTAHPPAIELAERLAELAPAGLDHVFFTCGGSEAVEAAWKIVRQYHLANGEPQRTKAIARDVAYHGVTLGALVADRRRALEGAVRPAGDRDPPRLQHERASARPRRRRGRVLRAPARPRSRRRSSTRARRRSR